MKAIQRLQDVFKSSTHKMEAIFAVIALIFCGLCVWVLFGPLPRLAFNEQTEDLSSVVKTGAAALKYTDSDEETAHLFDSIAHGTNLRVTLIDTEGNVLYDSEEDLEALENHLDRPEVQEAIKSGEGIDTRVSESDGIDRLYVANTVTLSNGKSAIFRASKPLNQVNIIANRAQLTGIAFLITGILIIGILIFSIIQSTRKPIDQINRVRTDFVVNASHELKTPAAGIALLAESIEDAAKDKDYETVQTFASHLTQEATRLQKLVRDLLDLSRLEQSTSPNVITSTVDLSSVVSTSVESERTYAAEKNIQLIFEDNTLDSVAPRVQISGTDATLIATNLIDNAIRYSNEGGTVKVTLDTEDQEVLLSVEDNGVGISATDIPRIFERFYRVDVARSKESGGTGLGLSLVRHAVMRAHGKIEVESNKGEGSKFTVRFPL